MSMKRIGTLVILGCLLLTMTACSGESSATPTLPSAAAEVKGDVGAEGVSAEDVGAKDINTKNTREGDVNSKDANSEYVGASKTQQDPAASGTESDKKAQESTVGSNEIIGEEKLDPELLDVLKGMNDTESIDVCVFICAVITDEEVMEIFKSQYPLEYAEYMKAQRLQKVDDDLLQQAIERKRAIYMEFYTKHNSAFANDYLEQENQLYLALFAPVVQAHVTKPMLMTMIRDDRVCYVEQYVKAVCGDEVNDSAGLDSDGDLRLGEDRDVERGLADPSERTLYSRNSFVSRGLDLLKSWTETFFPKIKETEKITFEHLLFIPIVAILHFLIGW